MLHEQIKITKKEFDNGLRCWVMCCPKCGAIQASASERQYLPEWTTCSGSEPLKTLSTKQP